MTVLAGTGPSPTSCRSWFVVVADALFAYAAFFSNVSRVRSIIPPSDGTVRATDASVQGTWQRSMMHARQGPAEAVGSTSPSEALAGPTV